MTELLSVSGLTKRFGGLTAVNDLTFTVGEGEVVGLLGPNGSGKTTVLNMISGGLKPTSGTIRLRGKTVGGLKPHRIAREGIARTFQLVRILPSLTTRENVAAALAFRAEPSFGTQANAEADDLLRRVGLQGRGTERAGELTYIDQKRIELARALGARPKLLLLDEWLAGLNPTELRIGVDLIAKLGQSGVTIILVEHVMEAVNALCRRCIVMNAGTLIADGPTAEVLKDGEVVKAYLGSSYA